MTVSGRKRLHVMYVAGRLPYPPHWGGALRVYQQVRLLSSRHRVTLITQENPQTSAEDLRHLREMVEELVVVRCPKDLAWLGFAAATLPSRPLQLPWFYHPALGGALRDALDRRVPDVIHVHTVRLAAAVEGIAGVPRVLDLVDALSMNIRRRGAMGGGGVHLLGQFESRRLRRYEQEMIAAFDAGIVSSSVDLAALEGAAKVKVVGNGVETPAPRERPAWLRSRTREIVFLGRMSYFPNRDAVRFFAHEVFPRVRASAPDARLVILGSNPSHDVLRLGRLPGVTVTGAVPDARQRMADAAVVVCPMRCGSGVSNKVLEAAAQARPIVATPLAVEGLPQLLPAIALAQGAEEFALRVIELLNDGEAAYALGSRAAALAARHYSWDEVLTALEQTYDDAIARSRGRPASGTA